MINKKNLLLLLLLVAYVIIVVLLNGPLEGDEFRYFSYANNLAEGFYTNSENPDLSNGPGYPLVLLSFVATNSNLLLPRILNGIFVFVGVLYFYNTLRLYIKPKFALIFSFILGLYPPLLNLMPSLNSESLSFLLVNGSIFYFCSLYKKNKNWKNCLLTSFFLGFLILTKVIFFNVLILSAIVLVTMFFIKKRGDIRWPLFALIGAFLFTIPYLIYAYSVTGKMFYLGTRGGELLYHRSTPFEGEFGNWFSSDRVIGIENDKDSEAYHRFAELRSNHGEFYRQLQPLSNIQRDSAFKARAYESMKEHPFKYLKNTLASTGRLFFNIPNSYKLQTPKTYGYIIPNGFILVLLVLIAWPAFLARRKIPFEIKAVLLFAFIYGCGIVLLIGKPRYFIMMVPSLALFLIYCYTYLIEIKFVKEKH